MVSGRNQGRDIVLHQYDLCTSPKLLEGRKYLPSDLVLNNIKYSAIISRYIIDIAFMAL